MAPKIEEYSERTTKLSGATAISLCVMHALTVLGMTYQDHTIIADAIQHPELNDGLKFLFVNYGLWLSPIAVVLLSMREPILVGICTVPISIMFAGRLYYVWQFYAYGFHVNKLGDWAWFLTTLTGTLSIAILAVWLPIRIVVFFGGLIRRPRKSP